MEKRIERLKKIRLKKKLIYTTILIGVISVGVLYWIQVNISKI